VEISAPIMVGIKAAQHSDSQNADRQLCLDFYSEEEKIRARFYCNPGCRILDMLNKPHPGTAEQDIFIELTNNATHEEFYIHRDVILFVAADNANTARGLGSNSGSKQYPVVQKTPERINIQLKSYRLVGQAHLAKNMTLKSTLAENAPFLPLTDVMIIHNSKMIDERPFVAVNKSKISSVKKEFIY